jgi:hypothetical protein
MLELDFLMISSGDRSGTALDLFALTALTALPALHIPAQVPDLLGHAGLVGVTPPFENGGLGSHLLEEEPFGLFRAGNLSQ